MYLFVLCTAHSPGGAKIKSRRAIQIGLRNDYAVEWASGKLFIDVIDVTDFVVAQRDQPHETLMLPRERILTPSDSKIIERLRISADFDGAAARRREAADGDDGDDDGEISNDGNDDDN